MPNPSEAGDSPGWGSAGLQPEEGSEPLENLIEDRAPATLDGTDAEPGKPADPRSRRGSIVLKPKNHYKPLNNLRHTLTITVIGAIAVLAAMLMILVAVIQEPETQAALREVGTLILPPLMTLAGTSFAWFFAKRDKEGDSES